MAGYVWSPKAEIYCVRYRYYDPLLGRWLQRDPAGYVDGLNLGMAVLQPASPQSPRDVSGQMSGRFARRCATTTSPNPSGSDHHSTRTRIVSSMASSSSATGRESPGSRSSTT